MERGVWQATVHGVTRVRHDLVTKPPLPTLTLVLTMFCGSDCKSKRNKCNKNKWDYTKLESLYTVKETIIKMKRQPTAWENIFTNHILDKRLILKIYKDSCNSTTKGNQFEKMRRGSEHSFLQRRHTHGQLAHKNMFSITNHQFSSVQSLSRVRLFATP